METDVLVIGGGQAGLSAAHHLHQTGTAHLVVDDEAGPGGAWQHRWESLTMSTVNGIRELPGWPAPTVDGDLPANKAVPDYFAAYERQFAVPVRRRVRIKRVESVGIRLLASAEDGLQITARALINATGTWRKPFWPTYPGRELFAGRQLHTHDYRTAEEFADCRVVVIGGGISGVQLLMELSAVAADVRWVTRRPPVWIDREFTTELGRNAVALVEHRVRRGLPPGSVVSVTGLPLTPAVRAAREAGVLQRFPMFYRIDRHGVVWDSGRFDADVLLWCTGFRAALDHLAPLRLRGSGGGIVMDGTRTVVDPRVHLVGYGPSASTIGANRAGRAAVRDIRNMLGLDGRRSRPAGRHAVVD